MIIRFTCFQFWCNPVSIIFIKQRRDNLRSIFSIKKMSETYEDREDFGLQRTSKVKNIHLLLYDPLFIFNYKHNSQIH